MHSSLKGIICAGVILITVSCGEEFLNRSPKGQLTFDTFFETPEHAVWATNAIYQQFRVWEMSALPWIGLTDIISDDADKGSFVDDAPPLFEIDEFTFTAVNSVVGESWQGNYHAIFRANLAIENIPTIEMDEALRNRLVGEARFLRAYAYFRLVNWFGDVPLIDRVLTSDEYYNQSRAPKQQVIDFMKSDLLAAIDVLPEKSDYPSSDLGRVTKGAARGILAKLYMMEYDFTKAAEQSELIINSGEYALLTRYADNFLQIGEHGNESIFEISAVATQAAVAGPGSTPFNMVQGVRGIPNLGWGFNRPSDDLNSAYEVGDPRRQATILYVGEVLPDGSAIVEGFPELLTERFNQKAWVPAHSGLQDNGPGNIRILRYADILLIAAEAFNEIGNSGKALQYLNQVRARARGTNNFILPDVTTTVQSELREKIYAERRVELAMEQQRWFDLARWGRIVDEMSPLYPTTFKADRHTLLPIPQTEVDLSGGIIMQNDGY